MSNHRVESIVANVNEANANHFFYHLCNFSCINLTTTFKMLVCAFPFLCWVNAILTHQQTAFRLKSINYKMSVVDDFIIDAVAAIVGARRTNHFAFVFNSFSLHATAISSSTRISHSLRFLSFIWHLWYIKKFMWWLRHAAKPSNYLIIGCLYLYACYA